MGNIFILIISKNIPLNNMEKSVRYFDINSINLILPQSRVENESGIMLDEWSQHIN